MKTFRFARIIPLMIIIVLISACGGGGGGSASSSTTISGVAATGAPIVGTITLKDMNGLTDTATTDSYGNFSLDVAGFTPPFVLKATWTENSQARTLFSASMQTGSVHINPLTNLALALATGSDPATVFGADGAAPNTSGISEASLNAAVNQMRTLLDPLLDEYGITNFDPLHGSYVANPENKLDAMLDVISISTASGTVTINNRLTGTVIATGSVTNPAGITLDQTRFPAAAALEDIGEITARVNALGAAMKLGATLTAANLEEFFVVDPNYGTSNGHTRAQDIASIVALFGPGGSNTNGALKELRNVRIVADISSQYTDRGVSKVYILRYDFIYESGTIVHGNNVTFGKETESGLWKFIGDPPGGIAGSNLSGSIAGYYLGDLSGSWTTPGNLGGFIGTGVWVTGNLSGGDIEVIKYNPATSDDIVTELWKIVKNGSVVELSYKQDEVFFPCMELNLETSALRLRYSADSAWSPSVILTPSFQGESAAYQGAPISAQWTVAPFGGILAFSWGGEGSDTGEGFIKFSAPTSDGLSASVYLYSLSDPAQTTKFQLLTLISDAIPADQLASQSVTIGSQAFPVPQSGPFIQPPVTGTTIIWNGSPGPIFEISDTNVTTTGQVSANTGSQSATIRLYMESDQYNQTDGSGGGGYTLTVKP